MDATERILGSILRSAFITGGGSEVKFEEDFMPEGAAAALAVAGDASPPAARAVGAVGAVGALPAVRAPESAAWREALALAASIDVGDMLEL